jgi:hypothetical protein
VVYIVDSGEGHDLSVAAPPQLIRPAASRPAESINPVACRCTKGRRELLEALCHHLEKIVVGKEPVIEMDEQDQSMTAHHTYSPFYGHVDRIDQS